jgi:hypothetical protein
MDHSKIMEGLAKNILYGGVALVCGGIWTATLYSLYHGGVRYRLESRSVEFDDPKDSSKNWSKRFLVFSITKGPGKDNIDQDLQELVAKTEVFCKCCGAHQDEMVLRKKD